METQRILRIRSKGMKKFICKVLIVFGLCMILGIIGGIDNGEPVTNLLYIIPIILVIWVSVKIGEV
jgi:hypothetical protein